MSLPLGAVSWSMSWIYSLVYVAFFSLVLFCLCTLHQHSGFAVVYALFIDAPIECVGLC